MTFLNLFMLLALPAAAIPVVIYYLVNRKRTVLRFAAFEWMMKAVAKRRRLNRIDDIMKLIAKICLVLAVILFCARPAFDSPGAENVLIVMDTTFSMGAKDVSGRTRLAVACEVAESLTESFPGARFSFASFDGELDVFLKDVPSGGPFGELEILEPSGRSAAFGDFTASFSDLPDRDKYDTVCYVSDFQASDYSDPARLKADCAKLSGIRTVFVPVESPSGRISNTAIESFSIPEEGFVPGRNNLVRVVVANYSDAPAESISLVLSVDGVKKDMAPVTLAPETKGEFGLVLNVPSGKESLVELSIGSDSLEGDNTLFFTAHPREQINVLGVIPVPEQGGYKADVFMKNALLASADGGGLFKYTTMYLEQAQNVPLENYDVVFLFGIPLDSETAFAREIKKYLAAGRTVVSFSDLSREYYWKGLGLEAKTLSHTGKFTPDTEKSNGTYTDFMNDGRTEPEKFVFEKACSIKLTESDKNKWPYSERLVLKGLDAPAGYSFETGGGRLIILGYMPLPSFTSSIFNGNFVQYSMRIMGEAVRSGVFTGLSGSNCLNIPLSQQQVSSFMAGETLSVVLSGARSSGADEVPSESVDAKTLRRTSDDASGAGLFLALDDVPSASCFGTVMRRGVELFKAGLNPARTDSNLAPADAAVFVEAVDEGLLLRRGGDVVSGRSRREGFGFALALLILAAGFDIYAHFLRRK